MSFGILRAFISMRGVVRYVREQIDECRRHPRPWLITELVRAEEDGDKLSEDAWPGTNSARAMMTAAAAAKDGSIEWRTRRL